MNDNESHTVVLKEIECIPETAGNPIHSVNIPGKQISAMSGHEFGCLSYGVGHS